MSETKTTKEGRVNIALRESKKSLRAIAKKEGTTESNLARVLILDGLARLKSGELKFRGPSIEPTNPASESTGK